MKTEFQEYFCEIFVTCNKEDVLVVRWFYSILKVVFGAYLSVEWNWDNDKILGKNYLVEFSSKTSIKDIYKWHLTTKRFWIVIHNFKGFDWKCNWDNNKILGKWQRNEDLVEFSFKNIKDVWHIYKWHLTRTTFGSFYSILKVNQQVFFSLELSFIPTATPN